MFSRRKFMQLTAVVAALVPAKASSKTLLFEGLSPDIAPNLSQTVPVKVNLLMDASNSMSDPEFRLQAEGTANALRSDPVKQAIKKIGAVAICGTQFSSKVEQTMHHALLTDDDSIDTYADLFAQQARIQTGYTHISDALNYAAHVSAQSPYSAEREVIDISGDGYEQRFADISLPISVDEHRYLHAESIRRATRRVAEEFQICVNGLAICTDDATLDEYFQDVVVTPKDIMDKTGVDVGRTWSVTQFQDIEIAMRSKLITELAGPETPYNQPNNNARIVRFG